jgi:hypothetical protein|tara:strand:+ start:441 stop:647 length:207 start_codon:yes stop_codon:yes gene_type:complete
MEELLKKVQEQVITQEDFLTMLKVIDASVQRGAIRSTELTTVGKLWDKLTLQVKKYENSKKQEVKEDG